MKAKWGQGQGTDNCLCFARRAIRETCRYNFSLSQNLILGYSCEFTLISAPQVSIQPKRIICNTPCPDFVSWQIFGIGKEENLLADETDSYAFSPVAVGVHVQTPKIEEGHPIIVEGTYSGRIPPGFQRGNLFVYVFTIIGTAEVYRIVPYIGLG